MGDAVILEALPKTVARLIDESRRLRKESEELIDDSRHLRRQLARILDRRKVLEALRPAA